MPLLNSKSKGAKRKNYLELMTGEVSSTRKKAITTIMKRRKIGYEQARAIQAKAITHAL